MNLHRINQVVKYSILHSNELRKAQKASALFRLGILIDMIYCFFMYHMWTNQYIAEEFYNKSKKERVTVGEKYRNKGLIRDKWQKEFISNRRFLNKYSQKKYELPRYRIKRNKAYSKRYNMGINCHIEYGVELSRQHYLDGSISIGNNVLLAKNVFIDYSGKVIIKDNVQLTNGVIIETHHHCFHTDYNINREINKQTNLVIEEGAVIGSRAIILSSCEYIGKHARVGAGAIVTKDVIDYSTVVGIPAKVIKYNN